VSTAALTLARCGRSWKSVEDSCIVGSMNETHEDAATLIQRAAELSARAAELAVAGNVDEALDVEAEADQLRRRARAAATRRRQSDDPMARAAARLPSPSVREVTIAALGEIGVPVAPRVVTSYARARFGADLDHRALASLRRDEARAWQSSRTARTGQSRRTDRAVYVVPALEGRRFLQVRGKVALSTWPLEQRILGPWSERADHLTATINLARQLAWLAETDTASAERLADLVAASAATIPGAAEDHARPDAARVEAAAQAELEVLGPEDRAWRTEAAARARAQLDEAQQLWGAAPPAVVSAEGA
jgi:hypothetical protein